MAVRKEVPLKITISNEAYNSYKKGNKTVINSRLRKDNEDFLDALLSVDMSATPDRRATLQTICSLN